MSQSLVYVMEYTYNNTSKVHASFDDAWGSSTDSDPDLSLSCEGLDSISSTSFESIFKRLKTLVAQAHTGSIAASVTAILQQAEIPSPYHLWFAIVIEDMIQYYQSYNSWGGEYENGVGFLGSDTTSSFFNAMQSTS
jgi:hypothetical protein